MTAQVLLFLASPIVAFLALDLFQMRCRPHHVPEARLVGTRLVISLLTRSGPDQAEQWAEKVYNLLPRIGLTKPLIGGRIRQRIIREHWDEVARLIASLRHGTASASLLVSKLAGYPRQSHLAVTLGEIGRIERSLFTLAWLQDPDLRRRVTAGLNKGEAHHSLKRAVRFYRRGSVSDRTQLDQEHSAMALNLVVAAIILWNTAYLDLALKSLKEKGTPVPETFLPHISPLGWEHITLTGTSVEPGGDLLGEVPPPTSSRGTAFNVPICLAALSCQSVLSGPRCVSATE